MTLTSDLRSERNLPLRPILLIGTVSAMVLMFLWLWFEVAEGDLKAIDTSLLLAFRTPGDLHTMAGPVWLRQTMLDLTTLGSATMLTIVIIGSASFMALKKAYRTSLILLGATISGSVAVALLKGFFVRPRPILVDHLVIEHSASFPSGHAANSAIVYLTIAALFMRIEPDLRTRLFVLMAAILLTLAIGISRVALGVHWPSDVLAGWMFGAAWASLWALVVKLPRAADPAVA
ncbi:phosphatase PAP2 family protein [Sphingorhabdus soli]|uniref:Phosphatase PAP2 family protein n=1 Tax=Flavisphingopyxis soli TaxID=2601267 RepID=A0A5C6U5K2_9SPHN|nr:phosphatase PAP2 family protein [Sphingorhabdus soli]TXC68114.1 phosphatase PAP2 family protein [Sphingorhabdus soli]